MKRWPLALALAALAFSLTLASCDAMFETNLFAKATHDQLTASSVADMSTAELQELMKSADYLRQIADDEGIQAAALQVLQDGYGTMAPGSGDAAGQAAAVTAADIMIQTDPDASAFSASFVGALESFSALGDADPLEVPAKVSEIVKGILPRSLAALATGPNAPMPAAFEDMLATFTAVKGVYSVLGSNLIGTDTGVLVLDEYGNPVVDEFGNPTGETVIDYAYESGVVSDSEALSIAVNAAISTVVTSVEPVEGYTQPEAIWKALCDPPNAAIYITFSVDSVDGAEYLSNLVSAANFDL